MELPPESCVSAFAKSPSEGSASEKHVNSNGSEKSWTEVDVNEKEHDSSKPSEPEEVQFGCCEVEIDVEMEEDGEEVGANTMTEEFTTLNESS